MDTPSPSANAFELLELPDGSWCVAGVTSAASAVLVAGSFARLEPRAADGDPVGFYPSREEAEIAVQRATRAARETTDFTAFARQIELDA